MLLKVKTTDVDKGIANCNKSSTYIYDIYMDDTDDRAELLCTHHREFNRLRETPEKQNQGVHARGGECERHNRQKKCQNKQN